MTDRRLCRRELLNRINAVSFAMNDAVLFLDTHPCNEEALAYFEEVKNQRVQALKEYAECYGPLTLDSASTDMEHWTWINEPWPWQEGGC